MREKQKKYADNNKERKSDNYRIWAKNNRDKINACKRKRRKMGGGGLRKFLNELRKSQNFICPLCKEFLSADRNEMHVDHIMPLIKGGNDNLSNIQAAHSYCNLSRGSKDIEEYHNFLGI